jgi:hypothetical protein
MDPAKNNNWNPSTWQDGVIDPEWKPDSAFDANKDVLAGSRSSFGSTIVDTKWEPQDGFKKDDSFFD